MVKSIFRAALIAGAAAAATWSVKRWLDLRSHATRHAITKEAIRDWENEGGAVHPRPLRTDDPGGSERTAH